MTTEAKIRKFFNEESDKLKERPDQRKLVYVVSVLVRAVFMLCKEIDRLREEIKEMKHEE